MNKKATALPDIPIPQVEPKRSGVTHLNVPFKAHRAPRNKKDFIINHLNLEVAHYKDKIRRHKDAILFKDKVILSEISRIEIEEELGIRPTMGEALAEKRMLRAALEHKGKLYESHTPMSYGGK